MDRDNFYVCDNTGNIYESSDGKSWQLLYSNGPDMMIIYIDSLKLFYGIKDSTSLLSSRDLIFWKQQTLPFVNSNAPPSLVYANDIFVLCANNMSGYPNCWNSVDGENWTFVLSAHLNSFQDKTVSVTFNGNSFMVAIPNVPSVMSIDTFCNGNLGLGCLGIQRWKSVGFSLSI